MTISAITNTSIGQAPVDSTESLRRILEIQIDQPVSYEYAFEIGQSLVDLCEAFIEDNVTMGLEDEGRQT
jgi:hypothetical protein